MKLEQCSHNYQKTWFLKITNQFSVTEEPYFQVVENGPAGEVETLQSVWKKQKIKSSSKDSHCRFLNISLKKGPERD